MRVSMIEIMIDGVPVIMPFQGYKTFSMVVKAIGYFTKQTSPTYFCTEGVIERKYGQPGIQSDCQKQEAEYISQLYQKTGIQNPEVVVIGPGNEVACYLGRVLNAPILPPQFIASAPSLEFVEQNAVSSNTYFVGHETDWQSLCIWVKPKNLAEIYQEMLEQAKVIIVYHYSPYYQGQIADGTKIKYQKGNIFVLDPDYRQDESWKNSKERKDFLRGIGQPEEKGYLITPRLIPHWEFSMTDGQIQSLIEYGKKSGKTVIVISSGDWQGFIPTLLFQEFYRQNGLRPEGITVNDYWCCHPFYESEFLRIPVQNFQYLAPTYVAEFRQLLDSINFVRQDAEYMIWSREFDLSVVNPETYFSNWGFPARFRSLRPYDVWRFGWEENDDLENPTRKWIVPQLKTRRQFREFQKFLTLQDIVSIVKKVRKTFIDVHC